MVDMHNIQVGAEKRFTCGIIDVDEEPVKMLTTNFEVRGTVSIRISCRNMMGICASGMTEASTTLIMSRDTGE